jgi:CubicO group peptidase (beta-lactamase class C family)
MTKPMKAIAALAFLVLGLALAVSTAVLKRAATETAPLFAQPPDVPSTSAFVPPQQWAAAVDRARPMVRAAIVEQNLTGVSVAVAVGNKIVWAEGFGWRDAVTRTLVTPDTRFHMGTAAPVVTAATGGPVGLTKLGLSNTGADAATEWSPEHTGEPEEDPPPFTFIRDAVFRPLGLAPPAEPLPGERATFYVPRSADKNPRQGRRRMNMRDLACCAEGKAFYSTPSDLVRFAMATKAESVNGELAGGSVMSLITRRDQAIVVAVASNVAYANTAALAERLADVFAKRK